MEVGERTDVAIFVPVVREVALGLQMVSWRALVGAAYLWHPHFTLGLKL